MTSWHLPTPQRDHPNNYLQLCPHPHFSSCLSVNCVMVNTDYESISCCLKTGCCCSHTQVLGWTVHKKLDGFFHYFASFSKHSEFISDMTITFTSFVFLRLHLSLSSETPNSATLIQHMNLSYFTEFLWTRLYSTVVCLGHGCCLICILALCASSIHFCECERRVTESWCLLWPTAARKPSQVGERTCGMGEWIRLGVMEVLGFVCVLRRK